MAIMRINKTTDYTVMSNYHFREKGMSLKAKGLLSLMLSLPEDWDFTVKGLANLNKDGVDGVRAALEELKTFGYLRVTRERNEKGQVSGTVTTFTKSQHRKSLYWKNLKRKSLYWKNQHRKNPYRKIQRN